MRESIVALGFVAYLFSDVLPYVVREMMSLALTNPVVLGAVALALFITHAIISIALRYSRVLALAGASYIAAVVIQRHIG